MARSGKDAALLTMQAADDAGIKIKDYKSVGKIAKKLREPVRAFLKLAGRAAEDLLQRLGKREGTGIAEAREEFERFLRRAGVR
jgi:hypothetical protein